MWQVWLLFLMSNLAGQLIYMLAVHLTARFSLKKLGYDTAFAPRWLESRWQRFLP
jgi:formate/nitrite transporter FocA (FNT family)